MKLGITGSSTFSDYEHLVQVLEKIPVPITLIVTGGGMGAEKMARRYARMSGISVLVHHAKPEREVGEDGVITAKAFHVRNMLLVHDSDNILVFAHLGTQRVNELRGLAQVAGKRCNVVYLEHQVQPSKVASRYGETV